MEISRNVKLTFGMAFMTWASWWAGYYHDWRNMPIWVWVLQGIAIVLFAMCYDESC